MVSREHGFAPHITLSYVDPDSEEPDIKMPYLEISFDRLYLWYGDELEEFPFNG